MNTQDPTTGEVVTTWGPFLDDEPASVLPLNGREFIQSQALQSEVTGKMVVRYQSGYLPTMRILFENTAYEIMGLLPDETARGFLTIMVRSGIDIEAIEDSIIDGGSP